MLPNVQPFFNSNKILTKEELCVDNDRHGSQLKDRFCTVRYDDKLASEQIRLDDEQANASEILLQSRLLLN